MIHLYEMSKISTSIKTENKLVAARGWEEENENCLLQALGAAFQADENTLELDRASGYTMLSKQ